MHDTDYKKRLGAEILDEWKREWKVAKDETMQKIPNLTCLFYGVGLNIIYSFIIYLVSLSESYSNLIYFLFVC